MRMWHHCAVGIPQVWDVVDRIPLAVQVAFLRKWDPGRALELIQAHKINFWVGVPTMVQDLLEHPEYHPMGIRTITRGTGGLCMLRVGGLVIETAP